MRKRQCGTCNACCTTQAVESLDKANYEPCRHLSPVKGCAIYGDHPDDCKAWRCAWLLGQVPAEHRPDRLGVVVTIQQGTELPEPTWTFLEAFPEGFRAAEWFIRDMSKQVLCALVQRDGRRTFRGPPESLARLDEIVYIKRRLPVIIGDNKGK